MSERKCYDIQGREVDCTLTENWLNAAGLYLIDNGSGPTEAILDLGTTGLHGFFGEVALPPTVEARTSFIDDPFWKHLIKIALILLVVVLFILNAYTLIK